MKNSVPQRPIKNRIKTAISKWWQGTYVPEPPGSPFLYGQYQKHWTAKLIYNALETYKKNQATKWLLGIFLGSLFAVLLEKFLS